MAVSSEIPGGMVGSAILGQHKAPAARSTLNTGGDNYEYWPIYTGISIAVCLPAALRSSYTRIGYACTTRMHMS